MQIKSISPDNLSCRIRFQNSQNPSFTGAKGNTYLKQYLAYKAKHNEALGRLHYQKALKAELNFTKYLDEADDNANNYEKYSSLVNKAFISFVKLCYEKAASIYYCMK